MRENCWFERSGSQLSSFVKYSVISRVETVVRSVWMYEKREFERSGHNIQVL